MHITPDDGKQHTIVQRCQTSGPWDHFIGQLLTARRYVEIKSSALLRIHVGRAGTILMGTPCRHSHAKTIMWQQVCHKHAEHVYFSTKTCRKTVKYEISLHWQKGASHPLLIKMGCMWVWHMCSRLSKNMNPLQQKHHQSSTSTAKTAHLHNHYGQNH